jgi:hypothetical protein
MNHSKIFICRHVRLDIEHYFMMKMMLPVVAMEKSNIQNALGSDNVN